MQPCTAALPNCHKTVDLPFGAHWQKIRLIEVDSASTSWLDKLSDRAFFLMMNTLKVLCKVAGLAVMGLVAGSAYALVEPLTVHLPHF